MDIVVTIPTVWEQDLFNNMIDMCSTNGICYYRLNLSKCRLSSDNVLDIIKKCHYIYQNNLDNKIIFDLPFPHEKVRIFLDEFAKHIHCGDEIICSKYEKENKYRNIVDFRHYFTKGEKYFYQDGEGEFLAEEVCEERVKFISLNNFEMKSGKGVVSNKLIDSELDVNLINLVKMIKPAQMWFSFVENTVFLNKIKKHIDWEVDLFMKIENETGYNELESILREKCGIIVARGDLALNVNLEDFFDVQSNIVSLTKKNNRKVYIASGFLNSMVKSKFPSRADIIDVSHAFKLGSDGIVLNVNALHSPYFKDIIKVIKKCSS